MGEPSGAAIPPGKPANTAKIAESKTELSQRLSSRVKAYNKLIQESRESYIRNPNISRNKKRIILSSSIKTVSTEDLTINLGEKSSTAGDPRPNFPKLESMEKTDRPSNTTRDRRHSTGEPPKSPSATQAASQDERHSKLQSMENDNLQSMQKQNLQSLEKTLSDSGLAQSLQSKENAFYLLSKRHESGESKTSEDSEMEADSSENGSFERNNTHTAKKAKRNSPKGPKTDSSESSENELSERANDSRSIEQLYLDSTDKDDRDGSDVAKSQGFPETLEKTKKLKSLEKTELESMENENLESMEKIKNFKFTPRRYEQANKKNEDDFVSGYVAIPSAEGIKITIKQSDVPQALRKNIMEYNSGQELSGDENQSSRLKQTLVTPILHPLPDQPSELTLPSGRTQPLPPKIYKPRPKPNPPPVIEKPPPPLHTSPNSTFPLQRNKRTTEASKELNRIDIISPDENMDTQDFISPPKLNGHLKRMMKQKAIASLPKPVETRNRFQVLTESEEEEEDEEILKKRELARKERREKAGNQRKNSTADRKAENPSATNNNKKDTIQAKKKNYMPPIVMDGVPEDHQGLTGVLREIIKGNFNLKYTNNSTIVFTEDKDDYDNVIRNIKSEEMSFHTYTNKTEKSHAFVLRGLGDGTKIDDLEEDLMQNYEIKTRSIYRMTTRNRPLFLVITDPSITLDYLNRNVRVVLYTRITWELRRSTKQIIQCHNCQAWGHATSN
ncbi:unnamed protein product [Psylliodes chrysocephalus]|uniref:Uncharacterized protein n=1 Tax=Psylliodes chrysocephalus TaxID=3402493 RepID=A0A9P0GAP2_9CUCU|nr:unnamed protein product [Psylliodes chrysocephala]